MWTMQRHVSFSSDQSYLKLHWHVPQFHQTARFNHHLGTEQYSHVQNDDGENKQASKQKQKKVKWLYLG